MGTSRRRNAGRGQQAAGESQNRTKNEGQKQTTMGDGSSHGNYFIQVRGKKSRIPAGHG
jgi:hypothetical protein